MSNINEDLDDAINRASLVEVKKLIEDGADLEYRDSFGCTPLLNAAWVAASDVVEYLLAEGADCYAKNKEGKTALDMARSVGHDDYGHFEVVGLLEKHMGV